MEDGGWGVGARKLYIIHNIFQEDKQPEQEEEHTIQQYKFFFFFFFFLLSAVWYFKPNNMYCLNKVDRHTLVNKRTK